MCVCLLNGYLCAHVYMLQAVNAPDNPDDSDDEDEGSRLAVLGSKDGHHQQHKQLQHGLSAAQRRQQLLAVPQQQLSKWQKKRQRQKLKHAELPAATQ